MMKQKTFEKSSDKIWKLKIKVIIFAPTFAKRKRKKVLWKHYISTSSTRDVVGILTYRQDYNRQIEILSKRYKQNQQRRVWSWLRMNASDRLNTCKSRGSEGVATLLSATGARVSNAYATCPSQGDNREKFRLIPHTSWGGIPWGWKNYRWRMGMRDIR